MELTQKKLLKKQIENNKKYENITFEKRNSNVVIKSADLKNASNKIKLIEEKLFNLTKIEFKKQISKYTNNYYLDNFKLLNKIIADIDIYKSYSKLSVKHNYCRPIIENKYENKSYLKLFDLRHPIIEIIHSEYEYIPNNVELSGDVNDGMLVFGPNATGKSTIMKSTGIAIIMAQCGMFVPCSRMIYYPYKKMFTRILGNDNLFKGQSSFAVEMLEVKHIIDNAHNNSLILGDEICRGTEDLSAISLVGSLLNELSKRQISLIFTTHLHKLPELNIVKKLQNIKFYHLTISIVDEKIIYLRKNYFFLIEFCFFNNLVLLLGF